MGPDAAFAFSQIGGGKLPSQTWGYVNATWPFVRLRMGPAGIQISPSFLKYWIVFTIPSWTASWDDLERVEVDNTHIRFVPRTGPAWTFFSFNTAPVMALVPERLRR